VTLLCPDHRFTSEAGWKTGVRQPPFDGVGLGALLEEHEGMDPRPAPDRFRRGGRLFGEEPFVVQRAQWFR